MRLKDKVAIVTGGGSGFGEGIVRKFIAEGARVVIADRDLDAALRVAAAVGEHARALRVDVAVAADVRLMMETAELHFGRLDILVNNAGVDPPAAAVGGRERGRLRPRRGGQHEGHLPRDARSRAALQGAEGRAWC